MTERECLRGLSNQQRVADYLALEGTDTDWIETTGDADECTARPLHSPA